MSGTGDLPVAGWYPDPEDASQLRYWDGHAWTEHRHPPEGQGFPHAAPAAAADTTSESQGGERLPDTQAPAQDRAAPKEYWPRFRAWCHLNHLNPEAALLGLVIAALIVGVGIISALSALARDPCDRFEAFLTSSYYRNSSESATLEEMVELSEGCHDHDVTRWREINDRGMTGEFG